VKSESIIAQTSKRLNDVMARIYIQDLNSSLQWLFCTRNSTRRNFKLMQSPGVFKYQIKDEQYQGPSQRASV
jgi:hypothetical protein